MQSTKPQAQTKTVALLTEGVDRNVKSKAKVLENKGSPSSRRAWIEINPVGEKTPVVDVALLTEGVDRNYHAMNDEQRKQSRPPHGGRG